MSEQKIDYRRYDCTKDRLETMDLNDLIDELHRLEDIEDNRDELMFALEESNLQILKLLQYAAQTRSTMLNMHVDGKDLDELTYIDIDNLDDAQLAINRNTDALSSARGESHG